MFSIFYFSFVILSIIYAAYVREKGRTRGLKAYEERIEANEVNYDYNRFNTNKLREIEVKSEGDKFIFQGASKLIQIANQNMLIRIYSELADEDILVDLVISPFIVELFDNEHYQIIDQDGVIFFYGNIESIFSFHKVDEQDEPLDAVHYLSFKSVTIDPNEHQVTFSGYFLDKNEFKFSLKHKTFDFKLEGPEKSIMDRNNFELYRTDNTTNS